MRHVQLASKLRQTIQQNVMSRALRAAKMGKYRYLGALVQGMHYSAQDLCNASEREREREREREPQAKEPMIENA